MFRDFRLPDALKQFGLTRRGWKPRTRASVTALGQCVAEMVAAQMFNEREGNAIATVYGAVTTGTIWKFLGLSGKALSIDMSDYPIGQVERILGILVSMVGEGRG